MKSIETIFEKKSNSGFKRKVYRFIETMSVFNLVLKVVHIQIYHLSTSIVTQYFHFLEKHEQFCIAAYES